MEEQQRAIKKLLKKNSGHRIGKQAAGCKNYISQYYNNSYTPPYDQIATSTVHFKYIREIL